MARDISLLHGTGSTHLPTQLVPDALSLGIKQPVSGYEHSQFPLPRMPLLGAHGQLYLVKEDGVRHQEDRRLKCGTEFSHERFLPTSVHCTFPRVTSQHRRSPTSHGRGLGSITVLWDLRWGKYRRESFLQALRFLTSVPLYQPTLHNRPRNLSK